MIFVEQQAALSSVKDHHLQEMVKAIRAAKRVFISGKGRSGLQMRGFAMRLMHLGLLVYVVDDVTTPGIAAEDLLIIGSGSGQTPSLVRHAECAEQAGANILMITAAKDSPIHSCASSIVQIAATTPKNSEHASSPSALPMGTLFEQCLGLLCDICVLELMKEMKVTSDEMFTRHANLE